MATNAGVFWDERYRKEGDIWGEAPSPSALILATYLRPGMRVLDIGYGYGRDLPFLSSLGIELVGIDPSVVGKRIAKQRMEKAGFLAPNLLVGNFEDVAETIGEFDAIVSHRVAHLLETAAAIERFVRKVDLVLKARGVLVIGARDLRDLDPKLMAPIAAGLYERQDRPGHRIRYWNRELFQQYFGSALNIVEFQEASEEETKGNSLPCHLTLMVATKGVAKPNFS